MTWTDYYQTRRKARQCVRCGKHPPIKGETRCRWCKAKGNRYQRDWRKRQEQT